MFIYEKQKVLLCNDLFGQFTLIHLRSKKQSFHKKNLFLKYLTFFH